MVRGNHILTNRHFHKNWQTYLKTWFNQPARKIRNVKLRNKKAITIAPRPAKVPLRPVVSCQSFRYNSKIKIGRGFSLRELKKAKINPKFAKSIGIAVDPRRTNKSFESLRRNVQRLKEYMSRIILYPKGEKKYQKDQKESEKGIHKLINKYVMPIKKTEVRIKSRTVTEEEKKFQAYRTLRIERSFLKSRRHGKKAKVDEQ